MKLNEYQASEIEQLIGMAKIQKRSNELIEIKLYTDKSNSEKVKSNLRENYQTGEINHFPLFEKGRQSVLYARVPIKNLKKVLEENYIKKYNWPVELETLFNSERQTSLGFPTNRRAPDHIEITKETTHTRQGDIIALTENKGKEMGHSEAEI